MYRKITTKEGRLNSRIRKFWLIMRLTTVILIATFLQVSAASLAQKINMTKRDASLEQVLSELRKQSGYNFITTGEVLDKSKPVTVTLKNEDFEQALKDIFEQQPITYTIEDKTVRLKVKEPTFLEQIKAHFSAIDIRGYVYDEKGVSLPGVTVRIKDGSAATITDSKGMFSFKRVEPDAVLIFGYIGYKPKEVSAAEDLGHIVLELSQSKLDEIKIVAYGVTTDRTSVGNVSSVSGKDIAQNLGSDPIISLEGRVPGLIITQQSGYAGQEPKVVVQGQNSIFSGNDPLYVVDGVPYLSQRIATTGSIIGGVSPLSLINPNDIESISVLKDADATAIYGSRAANGAILITTKKGKPGPASFEVNAQQGSGHVARTMKLLNTQQYLQIRRQAMAVDSLTPSANPSDPGYAPDLMLWNTNSYTDWQKVLLSNSSHYTDVNPSISGGSENMQYLVGATYHRETSLFPISFANQSAGMHMSLNSASSDHKFKLGLLTTAIYNDNQLPTADLASAALMLPPDAPSLYKADGSLNWAPNAQGGSTLRNPIVGFLNRDKNTATNFNTSLQLSYEFIRGLTFSSNLSYNLTQTDQLTTYPQTANRPEDQVNNNRGAAYGHNKNYSWNIEPQLSYTRAIAKGQLSAIIGGSLQQSDLSGLGFFGYGYPSDGTLQSPGFSTRVFPVMISSSTYKYVGAFARINYTWDGKYILQLTGNRDGSSRFGPENEFHNFGAAGLAWVFSEEKFFKEKLPFISFGKLNASYGVTGNDQIGDYAYYALYNPIYMPNAYQGGTGVNPGNIANPYIQWEVTNKLNLGGQINFLHDRLGFIVNYFRNRSSNQLLGYQLPLVTGFDNIRENRPATVQNTGLEFTLNTVNVKSVSFEWTTSFNISMPRNKLIRYDGLAQSSYATMFQIGQSLYRTRLFHYLGVDPQTGNYLYRAADGSVTTNPDYSKDQTVRRDQNPSFDGGMVNHIRYKSLSLDFSFSFRRVYEQNMNFGITPPGYYWFNQPAYVLNYWQKPGDQTSIGQIHADPSKAYNAWYPVANASDAAFKQTFFARLTNTSLSWAVPPSLSKEIGVRNLNIFARAQNLLTFTNYLGWDPETGGQTLPPLKYITLGLNAKF